MPLLAWYAWRFGLCYHAEGVRGACVCSPAHGACIPLGRGSVTVGRLLAVALANGRGGEA